MIDKVKIHLNGYSPNDNITWKETTVEDCPDKFFYNAKLYNSAFPKKKFSLKLLLTADEENDTFDLRINGSIRKWYYQKNSRKDLNYEEFIDCIRLLAKELGTTKKRILAGKVNKVEIGVTLLLKAKMRGINDCFVKYRNAEREVFEETTLYFKFANYKLVFYDKFLEINKNTIWSDVQKKVFETFYFLRFEINAKKVSGTTFKDKFDTVERIKENWNQLPGVIEKYITKVVFVDVISKERIIDINDYTSFIKHLTYLGIKEYGIIESLNLLDKSLSTNNKKKKIDQFIDIYRANVTDDIDLKAILLVELRKKLDRLYNKSKI
jgi:DNA-binding Lrp family transcriptional regulator